MSIEDLPILRAGTTLKFDEYKDRRAEVRYQREDDTTIVNLIGYVPGIFPKNNYIDRMGNISYMKNHGNKRRLLLIREVKIHQDDRGEDIWNDDLRVEIPLKQILSYQEIK